MENLILLHGALGSAETLEPLREALASAYKVYSVDFSGHGRLSAIEQEFSIALFASDVLEFMADNKLENAHFFGYSMGGYVALYLAQQQPGKVKSVFTLGTKFNWTPEAAAHEVKLLNPEKIKEKVPQFAATLANRHGAQHWESMMHKTAAMMLQLGNEPVLTPAILAQVQQPVQIATGDNDNMVTIEETVNAFRELPNARLLVLPATRHPLETIPVSRLQHEISLFTAATTATKPFTA